MDMSDSNECAKEVFSGEFYDRVEEEKAGIHKRLSQKLQLTKPKGYEVTNLDLHNHLVDELAETKIMLLALSFSIEDLQEQLKTLQNERKTETTPKDQTASNEAICGAV